LEKIFKTKKFTDKIIQEIIQKGIDSKPSKIALQNLLCGKWEKDRYLRVASDILSKIEDTK